MHTVYGRHVDPLQRRRSAVALSCHLLLYQVFQSATLTLLLHSRICTPHSVPNCKHVVCRIEQLELFDEFEEWNMLQVKPKT